MIPMLLALFNRYLPALLIIASVAMGAFSLYSFGHNRGVLKERVKWEQLDQARAVVESNIAARRAEIGMKASTERAEAKEQIRTVTKETIRYVTRYLSVPDPVPSGSPPRDSCAALPSGWRLLHDSAAEGRIPDPSEQPDGTPVAAEDLAETVIDNYGSAIDNADKLRRLQEWIRQNIEVNPAPTP